MTLTWNCLGQYYTVGANKYRRVLYLGYDLSQASDALVVMMNPGGSKPMNGEYKDQLTAAIQDKTQNKIQAVMEKKGWNKATVINLSDLIEPKSWQFNKKLKKLTSNHSIFDPSRRKELETICGQLKPNAVVLVAWGVAKQTAALREKAFRFLQQTVGEPIGFTHGLDDFSFLHPMAYKFGKGAFEKGGFKWEEEILQRLTSFKISHP